MTLIDHRVLVSAPPEVVWELLGDLTAQAKWHTNITQCSLLTTQVTGEGVRYRLHTKRGPDLVCEILSWYNNLGYEYVVIDGPFGENRGRIRLQAIPEGTTVQWTFEYEYRGFGGGLRDRAGVKRRLNNETADSLKQLRRLVESTGISMDPDARDRVAMQPAPSAKERASLSETITRTQPVVIHETPPAEPAVDPALEAPGSDEPLTIPAVDAGTQPITQEISPPTPERTPVVIAEPPLAEDDTRPNPAVQQQETLDEPPAPLDQEPTTQPLTAVISKLATEPVDIRLADDYEEPPTEPKRPPALDEAIAQSPIMPEPDQPPVAAETAATLPPVDEQPPVEEASEPTSPPTEETPTPIKDTTPVVLPVVTDDEINAVPDTTEPSLEPSIVVTPDEPAPSSRPDSPVTVVSASVPPVDTEPQFADTIDAVLSEKESPPEPAPAPPAAPVEVPPPGPSLLEQDLKPLGPSIWDVFGMDAPSVEEAAPESAEVADTPPPDPPPTPAQETLPQVEAASEPAAAENHATEQAESKKIRQVIAVRSNSRQPGLRRQLGRQQAVIKASRRRL